MFCSWLIMMCDNVIKKQVSITLPTKREKNSFCVWVCVPVKILPKWGIPTYKERTTYYNTTYVLIDMVPLFFSSYVTNNIKHVFKIHTHTGIQSNQACFAFWPLFCYLQVYVCKRSVRMLYPPTIVYEISIWQSKIFVLSNDVLAFLMCAKR